MPGLEHALPAAYYLDEAAFRRERERLLYREWFCAGRADRVERPGSLQVVEVAGESVLLVRTRAGELRAHYNVCRNRGSQVVPRPPAEPGGPQAGPAGKAGSLRCPYHSWTYRLEGDLEPARPRRNPPRAPQCRQNSLPSGSWRTTQCWPASS